MEQRFGRWFRLASVLAAAFWIGCVDPEPTDVEDPDRIPDDQLTSSQAAEIAALEALGYVEGDQAAPEETHVTLHDPSRSWQGYNLYTSEHAPRVYLLDMDGRLLHEWEVKLENLERPLRLRRVRLFENGEVLALMEGLGLVRLDRSSNILWHYEDFCHHDFEVLEDGTIYVLVREAAIYPAYNSQHPILNDFVTILSPGGNVRKRVSLIAALERSACCSHYILPGMHGNLFHSNTLEILDGRLADRNPAFRAGNVLTSWRRLHAIGIIDVEREEVVWSLDGFFQAQHQPTVLQNGHLLLFDNFDVARGDEASRVIEVDPFTRQIHWEFHSSEDFPFFTRTGGSAMRLPNGNTLITETRKGRAFEVTPDREVVWMFVNPARVESDASKIARIYEMQRLPLDFPLDWIPPGELPTAP